MTDRVLSYLHLAGPQMEVGTVNLFFSEENIGSPRLCPAQHRLLCWGPMRGKPGIGCKSLLLLLLLDDV